MRRAFAVVIALSLAMAGCDRKSATPNPTAAPPSSPTVVASTLPSAAEARPERPPCAREVTVYEGSIDVSATGYDHSPDGDAERPIPNLDKVLSRAPRLYFTLDYPFEKPLEVRVSAPITLRRIVDAVRSGFRKMYEGTSQSDIPGMVNKDVKGAYGTAFHVIGDLVIEGISLCEAEGRMEIAIGS